VLPDRQPSEGAAVAARDTRRSGTRLAYYEYELTSGARHRNVEVITVRDGLIHEVQVFFGGKV
jgi:hypothetical protein